MNSISQTYKRAFTNWDVTMSTPAELVQQEIISTERSYCKNLKNLKGFLDSLQQDKSIGGKKEVQEFVRGFNKVLIPLLNMSEKMLSELERAKDNKDFARIFTEYAPYLKLYSDYIKSYESIMNSLKELQKNNQEKFFKLEQALVEQSKISHTESNAPHASRGIGGLFSHHILPVQRVPRYKLLLAELIKQTPETDSFREKLKQALNTVAESALQINETERQAALQRFLQEAYSKSYNSPENRQVRSITFSASGEGFFKISHIDTEKLQGALKAFQIVAGTVAINNGVFQKECSINATVGDKQVNFRILKGKPNGGTQGKEKSKDFHVVIDCNMATLTDGERRQLYQAAQNIGKAVITSMGGAGNKFTVEDPSNAAGSPQPLELSVSPMASFATRLTSLRGTLAEQAKQSVGEKVVRHVSSSGAEGLSQSGVRLEADKPTRMLNNELSLENVVRRVQESIASYNATHQNKLNWAVVLPENGQVISVVAPNKTEPNKTEPIFSVKQSEDQTQFEFQEKSGISIEAAMVAISAAESPVEIVSENIKDMEILAEAAAKVNATKETEEEPTEVTFSEETMGFLESKQAELKGALKEVFEAQIDKRQHTTSLG